MSMLAEPRKRKGYILVPRGKPLYEDDSRFGTKMLKKMGWSKGKGLGAKEDGSQHFIRLRHKNDIQGLGYKQCDDQWTQHEQNFTGLLKTLNGKEAEENHDSQLKQKLRNESEDDGLRTGFGFQENSVKEETISQINEVGKLKEKISGVSLEERSKQSRARVHYKKFIKGKDLIQYSEKDLANIFGKKAAVDEKYTNNLNQHLSSTLIEKKVKNTERAKEDPGVLHINTGITVSDYFKIKMESIKNIGNGTNCEVLSEKDCNELQQEDLEIKDIEDEEQKEKRSSIEKDIKINRAKIESKNETGNKVSKQQYDETEKPKEKVKTKRRKNATALVNNEFSPSPAEDTKELGVIQQIQKKISKEPDTKVANKIIKEDGGQGMEIVSDDPTITTKKEKRKKPEVINGSNENFDLNETASENNQTEIASHRSVKKDLVRKNVNSNAKQILPKTVNVHLLELDDIKKHYNTFNIYPISSFCAEKFRNINLNDFRGSILPQIEGYGLGPDIQLDVRIIKNDEERITNLWKGVLNKYDNLENPKTTYKKYVYKVLKARKMKQKRPKLYTKKWKRKNAFQII